MSGKIVTHQTMWDHLKGKFQNEKNHPRNSSEFRGFCQWAMQVMCDLEGGMVAQQVEADEQKTLEEYLKENDAIHHIDHSIRASVNDGEVSFYIHAQGYDSDTLDFFVCDNALLPKRKQGI